jgi:hypothetical protein
MMSGPSQPQEGRMEYQATATLVGRTWRVEVPDIGQVETEYLARVEHEARTLIAERLGIDPDSFEVAVSFGSGLPSQWTDPDGFGFRLVMFEPTDGGPGVKRYVPIGRHTHN